MDFIYNYAGWGSEVLVLVLGVVFLVHGWPKVSRSAGMASAVGWPKNAVMALGLVECAAAAAVITGFGTFYGSLAMSAVMVGALYHKIFKWKMPFKADNTTGWEFDLTLLAAALTVLLG